jgi:hypothetical protein
MKNENPIEATKILCLIVLSGSDVSETTKKELEEAIVGLKRLSHWSIEKITMLEDQRTTM